MELFNQPIQINKVTLKNRLVMPPMAKSSAIDGVVSDKLVDYYDEKSKGGAIGLIIMEHEYISQEGMADAHQVSISRDSDVEGLRKITEVVHKNGSKIVAQINHAGSSTTEQITGMQSVSASAVVNNGLTGGNGVVPQQLTTEEIQTLVQKYADAARRAKEAGFDGVELHSAHGYLLNQFYSPLTNIRTDSYGGSVQNRIRLHLEVIKAVRATVGNDFLVALRLGASDYTEGGSTLADSMEAAKAFEQAGVDLLDISGGMCGFIRPSHTEPGYFGELTEAIKQVVSIPVILTGGITDADSAEELLSEKKADLIGVGRAILKDSSWAKNAML